MPKSSRKGENMIQVIGRIKEHTKCCVCGNTKEGFCSKCNTKALDIVTFDEIEQIVEGHQELDGFNVEKFIISMKP